jgi:hypothetical protein
MEPGDTPIPGSPWFCPTSLPVTGGAWGLWQATVLTLGGAVLMLLAREGRRGIKEVAGTD